MIYTPLLHTYVNWMHYVNLFIEEYVVVLCCCVVLCYAHYTPDM